VTPVAHAAHWITAVAIAVPFVAALGWALLVTVRERRRGDP
jgi:hypothetical protein